MYATEKKKMLMSGDKKDYTGELVKIVHEKRAETENAVNEWLQKNPDIDITQRLMTSDLPSTSGVIYLTIAIFYRKPSSGDGPFRT